MRVEIGRHVLALGWRAGLDGNPIQGFGGDDLHRLPLGKGADLNIGDEVPAAAAKQLYRLAYQARIEERAVAADANDAIELERARRGLDTPQDVVERAALARDSGACAERGHGVIRRFGRSCHGNGVEHGAAAQAVDEMGEERLATERSQYLPG